MPITVAFRTLGCRLNQCETAQMEESLTVRGLSTIPWEQRADVRVLNTCTVTGKTDRACRNEIRRVKRADPACRLIVTGCYAQVAPERIAEIAGVDLVLGNLDKAELPDHVDRLLSSAPSGPEATPGSAAPLDAAPGSAALLKATPRRAALQVTDYDNETAFRSDFVTHFSGYTRAFLKVQNGCDARCSYCVIPIARGRSRSMPLADVLHQVRMLEKKGFREVVLTGIHLGCWGKDTGDGTLADLLRSLATDTQMPHFRLSSTEPLEVDDRVLAVMSTYGDRFAEHFHLPLQSGSDSVLRRMSRPYDTLQYAERARAVRSAFPDAAIGADVIVGFPGESEAEFQESMHLVESLPLTYLHVFPYSDRPGTRASTAPDKVPPSTISERSARLRQLAEAKDAAFQARFAGRELRTLLLKQKSADDMIVGLTGNYLEVQVPGDASLMNRFARVVPLERRPDGRWLGSLVDVDSP
ncbi:MAG: tRNA (N(6)-L-threonylcarbamoyladenosine(37)-C(2))-methylthiotransferase MtaB [Actinobacteria bacterium]|nr:tRNA (N(6)-L-threonylcarbamoyladenosine(37)-C(2))-methylthiotransferase MtaB [Actinomycetota bacterium]